MSRLEDDPLARLHGGPVPEPDLTRMHSTIRASTDIFAQEALQASRPAPATPVLQQVSTWLSRPNRWIVPFAVGGFAFVTAVAILPSLSSGPALTPNQERAEPAPPLAAKKAPDDVAVPSPAPIPSEPMAEAAPTIPRRMGAQQVTRTPRASMAPVERYDFDGLALGVRNMPEASELLLLESGREERLDITIKSQNERIALFDAFRENTGGAEDTIVVRSGMGSNQRWDSFTKRDGRYERSIEMSRLITDATTREEVLRRLHSRP